MPIEPTCTRQRPAGSRGGTSTPTSRSRTDATTATLAEAVAKALNAKLLTWHVKKASAVSAKRRDDRHGLSGVHDAITTSRHVILPSGRRTFSGILFASGDVAMREAGHVDVSR
jgi:hypothetical protein